MEVRWLRVLVDLADLGTLRAVAASGGYSTSAVSQHLARLQQELGCTLVEPVGRQLALTPDGKAFLPHARAALAALEKGHGELTGAGPLTGVVRVAGYATSVTMHIVPAVSTLRLQHPALTVQIRESEPAEVRHLLAQDQIDIGVIYDHDLVPRFDTAEPYATSPMMIAVSPAESRTGPHVIADPATPWIANSRGPDDDDLIRHVTGTVGVIPRIDHHIDSIDLVVHLVAHGFGAALVAADAARHPGVAYLDIDGRAGVRRSFVATPAWSGHLEIQCGTCTSHPRTHRPRSRGPLTPRRSMAMCRCSSGCGRRDTRRHGWGRSAQSQTDQPGGGRRSAGRPVIQVPSKAIAVTRTHCCSYLTGESP